MTNNFDIIIDSYLENKIGVCNDFLSIELASSLKQNLLTCFDQEQFHKAGTGNADIINTERQIRTDQIYWLDRNHNNSAENSFFDIMDEFVQYLNRTCYTGITGYEFHYTMYEQGAYYKKHLDQFKNNDGRQFSIITYLNEDWKIEDGGELCIHHNDLSIETISPDLGKSVFFKSNELEHEVLVTNKARMSITGWMKNDH